MASISSTSEPEIVSAETTRYLELLEQRIALLGSLADALMAARADVVSLDLDGLEARIADQERLCGEIRSLDAHIDRVQRQCAAHLAVGPAESTTVAADHGNPRLRETLDRLNEAQAGVKQLNDTHQVLLRRSRRTVGALLNSYHSFATTYSDPSSARATEGERV
jgi:hypothetical protein